jgi:hypothetical protein
VKDHHQESRQRQGEEEMRSEGAAFGRWIPVVSTWTLVSGIALVMAVGCGGGGGSTKNPVAPPPPGSAAGSIAVQASIVALDSAPGTFSTDYVATLADTLGDALPGATVTVTDASGTVTLVEDGGLPGTYRASRTGFASGTFTLEVTADTVQITGTVTGPDLHGITSHAPNQVIQASNPIHLTWSRAAAATQAIIETKNYQSGAESDDGAKTIPTPGNPPRNDQQIRVTRLNRAPIAGALAGSMLSASLRVSVGPIVAQ